jgi:polar amino acid transport system substrate-binding protein
MMSSLRAKTICIWVLFLLGLSACGKQVALQPAPVASAPPAAGGRVYVVGSDASYTPFEWQTDRKTLEGFDIEVLQAVADHAGFAVRYVNTPWEGIFMALAHGDIDIVASAVTITEQRKRAMDFSLPYFEARQLIAVAKGVNDVKRLQDLKDKGVAVQAGTSGDEVVQRLLGKGNANLKRFPTMPRALEELENGGVRAVVGDNAVIINYVRGKPQSGIMTVDDADSFAPEYYGFAVKKGNRALLSKIDAGIRAIRADGSYDRIYKKYFGY